ncbi:Uncharacterized protein At4g02000 [Linum perenne]
MLMTSKQVNFNILQHRLASLWRPGKGMTVVDLGQKLLLFRFYHEADLKWVIERGPWTFDYALLVLREIGSGETPTTVPLNTADFWVQIHGLPSVFCSEKVGRALGEVVGTVLKFDEKLRYSVITPYMRLRIRMDVTVPLRKEKKVRRPGGEWLMGKFRYERLPTFCYVCGRIGHIERHCEVFYQTPEAELVRNWDASLRAEIRKPSLLGGEQYLVMEKKLVDENDVNQDRDPLRGLDMNIPGFGIPAPNVAALLGNLGVRAAGWSGESEKAGGGDGVDMEGVEVAEDRKRRRGGEGGGDSSSVRFHVPKNVEKAGPNAGTCPPP